MFKARRKDIRRRPMTKTEDESDDDGNISDASVGTAPTPAAATAPPPGGVAGAGAGAVGDEVRPKKMRKKAKAKVDKGPKPVLSFGHEDEEESGVADKVGKEAKGTDGVFRVKRSKASKAMAKAAKDKTELPAAPQNDTARGSWHTATAGMYTAEGLAELRSTQAFTPKTSASTRDRRVRGGGGGGGAKSERIFAGDDAEMVHEAGQQGDLKGEGLDDEQMSRLKGQRDALLAAREAREKDDGGDDFIPLDGKASVSGAGQGGSLHGGRGGGADRGGAGEGAQEVDDEEQQRWEEEQVRRGARQSASKPNPSQQQQQQSGWGAGAFGSSAVALNGGGGGNGWGGTGAERPRFLGVDEMQKALREAGKQLRETHERNERQLQVLVSELATQASEEEKIVSQQKEAAERFVFFQATRTALSDLCGMLREKESMLSEVESAKRLLHARRLKRALEVRADDQEDQLLDARDAGVVIANLGPYRTAPGGPLSRSPALTSATGTAVGATSNGFGRQSPGGSGEDRVRRRGERERRRRRFVRGKGGDGEGWVDSKSFPWSKKERLEVWQALRSEGEESEGEEEREEERSRRLMEAAEMVMEDVDDNVKSVAAVKDLFENWKRHHSDQYAQAYCTLTLPKLFAPFVRLELVRWDPLTGRVDGIDNGSKGNKPHSGGNDQSSRGAEGTKAMTAAAVAAAAAEGGGGAGAGGDETDEGEDDLEGVLERFDWYRRLFDFSGDIPPPESAGYGAEEDPDQNLVPQLVENVALPLVAERLSTSYDAMSRRQTACLTATVSELLVYDTSEEALKTLLGSALEALQTAVRSLCIPVVGACPTPAARAAAIKLVRLQACRGLKLLRNCLAWRDLLSPQYLVPLTLGDLVAKRLVPALRGLAGRGVNGGGATGGKASARAGMEAGVGVGSAEALALCERAVELLPVDWIERPDASAALASLRICARLFGDGLEGGGRGSGGGAAAAAGGGVGVERVVRLQVGLGDDGAAKDLARRHGLKIA